MRGVGHAALHNPSEVNLHTILQSSVIYDQRLRDRIVQSKEAKKAFKRWKKVKTGNMADAGAYNTRNARFNCVGYSRNIKKLPHNTGAIIGSTSCTSRAFQQNNGVGDDPEQGNGVGDPVLDFKLDLDDDIVNLTWESTKVLFRKGDDVLRSTVE